MRFQSSVQYLIYSLGIYEVGTSDYGMFSFYRSSKRSYLLQITFVNYLVVINKLLCEDSSR